MIEIKTHFTPWHKVELKIAQRYISYLMRHITNIPITKRKRYIEDKHLRGIAVDELQNLS